MGAILGIGERNIAVDYGQLDIQYDANAIQLVTTHEEAEAGRRQPQTLLPVHLRLVLVERNEARGSLGGTRMGS